MFHKVCLLRKYASDAIEEFDVGEGGVKHYRREILTTFVNFRQVKF
jgi:hypothetical protein